MKGEKYCKTFPFDLDDHLQYNHRRFLAVKIKKEH